MQGCALRFYMHENQRHHSLLLYEWLLEQARQRGIHGGSALRAIAGFGRHGVISQQHFFELAGQLTVVVEFIITDAEAATLLAMAREDQAELFYTRARVEFGLTSPAAA